MYGVVLHTHLVRGESHNQRNTTGEVATQRFSTMFCAWVIIAKESSCWFKWNGNVYLRVTDNIITNWFIHQCHNLRIAKQDSCIKCLRLDGSSPCCMVWQNTNRNIVLKNILNCTYINVFGPASIQWATIAFRHKIIIRSYKSFIQIKIQLRHHLYVFMF